MCMFGEIDFRSIVMHFTQFLSLRRTEVQNLHFSLTEKTVFYFFALTLDCPIMKERILEQRSSYSNI